MGVVDVMVLVVNATLGWDSAVISMLVDTSIFAPRIGVVVAVVEVMAAPMIPALFDIAVDLFVGVNATVCVAMATAFVFAIIALLDKFSI